MPELPEDHAPWPVPDRSALGSIVLILDALAKTLGELEPEVVGYLSAMGDDEDVERHDLATMLDALDAAGSKVKEIQAEVAETFCRSLPFRTTSIAYADTCAFIPRWGGNRVAWDNERVRADVRAAFIAESERQGARQPSVEEILDAVEKVVSIIGSNVKTTGLRGLGLDPDDYCRKEPKPPTVQVVRS